jgi:hypothetical protein
VKVLSHVIRSEEHVPRKKRYSEKVRRRAASFLATTKSYNNVSHEKHKSSKKSQAVVHSFIQKKKSMEQDTTLVIPLTLFTLTSLISLRSARQFLFTDEKEEVFTTKEEELPKPEPLGGVAPLQRRKSSFVPIRQQQQQQRLGERRPSLPTSFEKLPLDVDAATLRAKLVDADAAKRRAMSRVAELERETANLQKRCAELEQKSMNMGDSLQQLSVTQRILSFVIPQLKARGRRGMLWKPY